MKKSASTEKVLNILVQDSYHTETITKTLQNHFGERANCHAYSAPRGLKIDVFFLSGRDILDCGRESLHMLKKTEGTERCKIVAVTALPEYREEIKRRTELGVDAVIGKGSLVPGLKLVEDETLEIILERVLAS